MFLESIEKKIERGLKEWSSEMLTTGKFWETKDLILDNNVKFWVTWAAVCFVPCVLVFQAAEEKQQI